MFIQNIYCECGCNFNTMKFGNKVLCRTHSFSTNFNARKIHNNRISTIPEHFSISIFVFYLIFFCLFVEHCYGSERKWINGRLHIKMYNQMLYKVKIEEISTRKTETKIEKKR